MVTIDTVLDLIQSQQRRYALYYLDEQDTPVPIEELAEEVAKMEEGSTEGPSDDEIRRYEVKLQHSDLPRVDEASFIEYDSEEGVVRLTEEPPEFKTIISVAEVIESPREG